MLIPLSQAIDRYTGKPGAPSSSYASYRRDAQRYNRIWVHRRPVPAVKVGARWMVDEGDLGVALAAAVVALAAEGEERARSVQRAADYDQRILHPGRVDISGGGYRVAGAFHFVWNDMAIAQRRSNGGWVCNTCWEPAAEEHGGEECHRCRDWGPCGKGCTLTGILCRPCGVSQDA